MKKEKKRLFALFIIGTFLLSTIAFVVIGITGSNFVADQQKPKQLDSFVLNEDVDSVTEASYVSRGYTFLKFYYNETPPAFLDALPGAMLAGNEKQLFVLKIFDTETRAKIVNIQNDFSFDNVAEENVISELCNRLIVFPLECSFRSQDLA